MTIMVGKTKRTAIAILFSCIALIFMASAASAQEDKKERGYNGCITIIELLSKFKRGEIVKGYIIDGDEIIKIIRTTRYAINIEDSIIEDGLGFPKLPREWDKEQRDEFVNVKNEIIIIDSEIQSKKKHDPSIQAVRTIFHLDPSIVTVRTIFYNEVQFLRTTFSGDAAFYETTFSGRADFSEATFSGDAGFKKATFSGEADFSIATFHELAYFKKSIVIRLFLDSTLFTKYADFRETMIGKLNYKCTSPAIIKGWIDFRNSSISEMHFQDIIFENDVDFSDVKFGIPLKEGKTDGKLATVFRFVTFESDAYFIRTEFHSDTAFERIKFKGDANFTDIAFKDFKHLLLSMDDLPDIQHWVREDKDRIQSFADVEDNKTNKTGEENLQPLTKVLYSLEEVFHSQNNLNDANKAYYYRKLMEHEDTRLMKHVDTSKNITSWQRVWGDVEWYFWGVPCGYATSWKKIVSWCGGFYLFFVILYSAGGKLTKTYQEEEDELRLRLFILPIKYLFHENEVDFIPNEYLIDHQEGWGKFIGALKFSMVIFFKIGYLDTKISGKILRIDAKYFVWTEWVIGYWLLAALVVTLSNTLPIVHRLISGIF